LLFIDKSYAYYEIKTFRFYVKKSNCPLKEKNIKTNFSLSSAVIRPLAWKWGWDITHIPFQAPSLKPLSPFGDKGFATALLRFVVYY
jgi:hypothetical protein